MGQLKIDLSELELAFDSRSEMISCCLDLETGDVISVSDEGAACLRVFASPIAMDNPKPWTGRMHSRKSAFLTDSANYCKTLIGPRLVLAAVSSPSQRTFT